MNVNDDNTEPPLTNSRLLLGPSSQFHQRRLNNDLSSGAGAGANAAAAATSTSVEMAFVAATDPLSELVWSPHNGLRLKCAGSSLNPKRSFLSGKDSEKTMSGNWLNLKSQVGESSHRPNEGKEFNSGGFEAPVLDIIGVLDDGKQKEETLQVNVNKMEGSDRTHGTGDAGGNDQKLDLENELESEADARKRKQCKASDKINVCPKSSGGKDHLSHENNISIGQSPTSRRIHRYRRKGKEKALSDGDLNTNPPPKNNRDDDSHESVESCNSTGHFSKGKKRWEVDDQQLSNNESKRLKQNHDSHGSTSFVRQDSSFVCWISNMMKAFPKPNQETAPLALTVAQSSEKQINARKKDPDPEFKNTGFQKMFKLICSRDTKARGEICISDGVCDVNAIPLAYFGPSDVFSEQLLLADEQCNQSTTPKSGAVSSVKSKDDEVLRNLGSDTKKNGVSPACSSLGKRKAANDNSNDCILRTDPLESLWITRFSHKKSGPSQMTTPHFLERERKLEAGVNSGEDPTSGYKTEAPVGLIRGAKFGNELKSSEAMASIFARRLDALKHISPSDTTRLMTCFFCGKKGHHLKDCLEITEIELDDLVKNVHSYDGAEESPRLCIMCYQLNHWAVLCPYVSSKRKKSEEFGAPMSLKDKVSQSKVGRINPAKKPIQLNNFVVSSIQVDGQKENPNTSSTYKFADDRQILGVPKGFFDAIKRLRLSRTNILKWTNSQIPLSRLDGFYLRLRLGKWEEGLGGTGYYVGCINGALDESLPKGSKSAIPVTIGGMKCLVESQYVSNHDFLEDELAAWWSLTFKSGRSIPSKGDIKQKVEERKKLGF